MTKRLLPIACGECGIIFQPRLSTSVYCSRSCLGKARMRKRPKTGFYNDLTGRVFGRLTVVGFSHSTHKANGTGSISVWDCLCSCGNSTKVRRSNLTSNSIISCGCRKKEIQQSIKQYSPTASVTHGCSRTRLGERTRAYKIWCGMKRRCFVPKCKSYKFYGGRGVTVCERWMKFENFLADMGEPPPGMSIDRYPDNTGNYEPGNCRWATDEQQDSNVRKRRSYTDLPENAILLKKIMDLHYQGKNYRDIASILNSDGITSPRGKRWWGGGIGRIVKKYEGAANA